MHKLLLLLSALSISLWAGETTLQTSYENLSFKHSKKKDRGKRYTLRLSHQEENQRYQMQVEQTDTETFKPPMKKDLEVLKFTLKYGYTFEDKRTLTFSYQSVNDNIMKETDGGAIYGVGYHHDYYTFRQFFSDYHHFNVYQTDLGYHMHQCFLDTKMHISLLAKYMHLEDKNSNNFSKNAKNNYLTSGIKLHWHAAGLHFGTGIFVGERIFAVMQNGFSVQHHAMAFKQTYMMGIGKTYHNMHLKLRYVHHNAEEIPIHNRDVKVDNIAIELKVDF